MTHSLDNTLSAAMSLASETYVFKNVEVRKTGRTASKELKRGKMDSLFEITPVDQTIGSWREWVRDTDLFLIT